MRTFCLILVLAVPLMAQEKYPITLTIVSSDSVPYSASSPNRVVTNCSSDSLGNTDCLSTGGHRDATNWRIVQSASATDGNLYILECVGGWRSNFASGFASGTGNSVTSGCMIKPGDYKAKSDKHGFKMAITDDKGKERELTMAILSVQRKK